MTNKQKKVNTSCRPLEHRPQKINPFDKDLRRVTVPYTSVPKVKPEVYGTVVHFLKCHSVLGTLSQKDGSVALDNCVYSQELFEQYLKFCDSRGILPASWRIFCQVTLVVISQIPLEDFAISVRIN